MVLRAKGWYYCWVCYYISYLKGVFKDNKTLSAGCHDGSLPHAVSGQEESTALSEWEQDLAMREGKPWVPEDYDHNANIQSWNPRDFFPQQGIQLWG